MDDGHYRTAWPMGLRMTCGAAPLQVEGPIDGGYVYFRARHGFWDLAIGKDWHAAVDATIDRPGAPVQFSGRCQSADWFDRAEARTILEEYLPKLRLTAPTVR